MCSLHTEAARQACGIQLSSHYSHAAFMTSMQAHKGGGLVTGTLDGLLSAKRDSHNNTQLQAELESGLWTQELRKRAK